MCSRNRSSSHHRKTEATEFLPFRCLDDIPFQMSIGSHRAQVVRSSGRGNRFSKFQWPVSGSFWCAKKREPSSGGNLHSRCSFRCLAFRVGLQNILRPAKTAQSNVSRVRNMPVALVCQRVAYPAQHGSRVKQRVSRYSFFCFHLSSFLADHRPTSH